MEHIRDEQLALYAGGDLPGQDTGAMAAHLASCGPCQKALSEFREMQSFVAASLQNPEESELFEVRSRLTAKLQPRPSYARHWAWWGAGIAAVLALFVVPRNVEHRPVVVRRVTPSVVLQKPSSEPEKVVAFVPAAISHTKRSRPRAVGIRTVTLIAQGNQEPIIKMTTADPNVIILWQTNERTEQKP